MIKKITSLHNLQIKEIVSLRKNRERKKRRLFVIEGRAEILLAINSGIKIRTFVFCPFFNKEKVFLKNLSAQNTLIVRREIFKKISLRQNPDGFLVVAEIKKYKIENLKIQPKSLVLVLDKLEKPGNLGAILRTADATAVDAVFVCGKGVDIYNHNVIRSSLGTVFTNKIISISAKKALEWLENRGFRIYAAFPRARKTYTDSSFLRPLAIVVGSEHSGLGSLWKKNSIKQIKLPMLGKIDSLNVSVSAAVLLYEAIKKAKNK